MGFFRDRRGAAAIEAAIMLPVYLLFVLGIIEFGHIYWTLDSLQYAADEASRCDAIGARCTSVSDTQTLAQTRATGINLTTADITVNENTVCSTTNGSFIGTLVTIQYTLVPLTATAIPTLEKFYTKATTTNLNIPLTIQSCFPKPT